MRSKAAVIVIVPCLLFAFGESPAQDATLEQFFTEFADDWVRHDPDIAVRTRFFSGEAQAALERQLTPLTDAWQRDRSARARDGLAQLSKYDRDGMDEKQRLSADVMQWQLETLAAGEPFLDYSHPLQQFNGASVTLINQLTVVHPVTTAANAESYVARLEQVDDRMREAIAAHRRRAESGILPPRFIVDATIAQMRQFVSAPARDNPLAQTLERKLQDVAEVGARQQTELRTAAEEIVAAEIYPAWHEAIAVLEADLGNTTDDAGLWRLPDGAEAYAHQLRRYTTTELTAEEIHEIGLTEVGRLEAEMDTLLRRIGLDEGAIGERVQALEARLVYPVTDESRRRVMSEIDDLIRDAEMRAEDLFDLTPVTPVIAQPYPEFRWASAAASYTPPPLDRSRPGIFQMPLRPNQLTEFSLRTLVYHETVPGHHFHVALFTENRDLPRFRRARVYGGISAITEGWALYAERLAAESGWYEGDIEGLIGQLDSALFRARRLVVDTGLHAKGWTRQQAIDYGIEPSEVERYIVMPGQACSYMIGQLKLVELRDRARDTLGDEFDIKRFHNLVLSIGPVPMVILEREVDAFIAAGGT